ncbi:MAG TPA: T9SS type A sorting domain-containing protein [Flavobacteriales bacterium]|nr:T9SS type A sorting domain-containing protein [Flavobacteriales bacterium]
MVSTTNLHLSASSPARDVGDSLGITNDIDGELREPLQDIGADEYYPPIGIDETNVTRTCKIFPNPTTGMVSFEIIPYKTVNEIDIYSSAGTFIEAIVIEDNTIDLNHLCNGVYFLRIGFESVKLIIVK